MLIPTGYAQVNWRFGGVSLPTGAEVTLGINLDTYANTIGQMAEDLSNVWIDNPLVQQSVSCSLLETTVKWGPNATGPQFSFASNALGGNGGATVAPNTAVLVSKTTGMGGRQGKGRMFIPGIDETSVDAAGNLYPGEDTAWQSAMDAMYADIIALDLIPALLRAPGSPITDPEDIDAFSVQVTTATQRRRLRR